MSNRSQIGQGKQVKIFTAGPAEEFSDSIIGSFHNTAICSSQGEDFASTIWPVVVKVQAGVTPHGAPRHHRGRYALPHGGYRAVMGGWV